MFRLVTCVAASCDPCGRNGDLDDQIIHFDDQASAEDSLTDDGWRVLAGGTLLCPDCAAARDCATYGHDWTEWRACRCGGSIPTHIEFLTEFRFCERCRRAHEERPITR